jgi:hypothetical protein
VRRSVLTLLAVASVATVPVSSAFAGDGPSPAAARAAHAKKKCDSNYKGACLKPNVSDYDCAGGSGNGPYYVEGPVRVVGNDHYRLDNDGDGVACES